VREPGGPDLGCGNLSAAVFMGFPPLLSEHQLLAVSPPRPPTESNHGSTGKGLMEDKDCWQRRCGARTCLCQNCSRNAPRAQFRAADIAPVLPCTHHSASWGKCDGSAPAGCFETVEADLHITLLKSGTLWGYTGERSIFRSGSV